MRAVPPSVPRLALAAALALAVLLPAAARAQVPPPGARVAAAEAASGLDAPREGSTHRRRHHRRRRPAAPAEAPYVITGPHVQIGWAHTWLPIGGHAGDVNVGTFSGFLATNEVRAGGTFEGGARDYPVASSDILARGQVFVGWQGLHVAPPFVPWVTANLGLGIVVGQRFGSALAWATWSLGAEAGADLYVARGFHLGGAVAFGYYAVGSLGYPSVELRLYFGL